MIRRFSVHLVVIAVLAVFAVAGTLLLRSSSAAPNPPEADINGDGVVSIFDLSILLANWTGTSPQADINGDNVVNIFDLSILLSNWGERVTAPDADITVSPSVATRSINPNIYGINAPAWLGSSYANSDFQELTKELGSKLIRLPGGSWSNGYSWLENEQANNWYAKPSEFIPIIQATDSEVIWTANQNGTPQESAALVAFFNGSTSDTTVIGTDRNGQDWGVAGDWAQMRVSAGYPDPVYIRYWEIGNEIYGGRAGTDCTPYGWEDVWTCDGREYVNGVNGFGGLLDFASAMKAVDPTIEIGGVGVRTASSWGNFGNEVIEEAGAELDFYIVHQYQWNTPPSNTAQFLAAATGTWQQPITALRSALLPTTQIAVTEYNSSAFLDGDTDDMMSRAVNGLHIAETIGEFAESGIEMATHWDLAHGGSEYPVAYGLINSESYERTPQYWAIALWTRMGDELVEVQSDYDPSTEVRVFATRSPGQVQLLLLNKNDSQLSTSVAVPGAASASQLQTTAANPSDFTVTVNGMANPPVDIESIPPITVPITDDVLDITLGPTSMSLITIDL